MLTDEQVQQIEQRAAAATPGPWQITPAGEIVSAVARRLVADALVSGYALGPDAENADFIAHAREDIPALLADRRAQRDALYRLGGAAQLMMGFIEGVLAGLPEELRKGVAPTAERLDAELTRLLSESLGTSDDD